MKIKNKDIRVGFELESIVLRERDVCNQFRDNDIDVDYHSDGSLNVYSRDEEWLEGYAISMEFVTEPLIYKSIKFENYFKVVSSLFSEHKLTINRTCGLHFHLSIGQDKLIIPLYLGEKKFVNRYKEWIKVNYPLVASKRLGVDYARDYRYKIVRTINITRYLFVNFTSLQRHGTLEFRVYGYLNNPETTFKMYRDFVVDSIEFVKGYLANIDARKQRTVDSSEVIEELNDKVKRYQYCIN